MRWRGWIVIIGWVAIIVVCALWTAVLFGWINPR